MSILGKGVGTTSATHIYTVPDSRRSVILISATNTNDIGVEATLSIRSNVDKQLGNITIIDGGTTYEKKPNLIIENGTGDQPAMAEAGVISMEIAKVEFSNIGENYKISDILTLDVAQNKITGDELLVIEVTAIDVNGEIASVIIQNPGRYQEIIANDDDIEFLGGSGTGAAIDAGSLLYAIKEISVTNPGNDYLLSPEIKTVDPDNAELEIGDAVLLGNLISDSITKYDAIDYQVELPKSSTLERSAIVLSAGDSVFARCNEMDSLNVFIFGIEEIA
ncbi:MAG: hypothetical protein U9R03_04515 [Candidatus Aerophobetes bacterium]|nr:hypothetical protein [Candidatus Aerophobetes bacterium]